MKNTKYKTKFLMISVVAIFGFSFLPLIPIKTSLAGPISLSCNSATIEGDVSTFGAPTTVWFDWGPGNSINNSTPSQTLSSDGHFNATINGLTENSMYSYRSMASNRYGTATGQALTFTTPFCTAQSNLIVTKEARMDSSIAAAIIGAIATIAAVLIGWWLQQKKGEKQKNIAAHSFTPDKDDIYFMIYLLHDAYEQAKPMSTVDLAEHHSKYAPLELEVKLIKLEKHGYIQRTNRRNAGIGMWQMLPKGVDFMFANGHQLQNLIEEQRPNA